MQYEVGDTVSLAVCRWMEVNVAHSNTHTLGLREDPFLLHSL